MPKPSDFFIGVTDFFSVLLPGALVTFFLSGPLKERLFDGSIFPVLTGEAGQWIVFLFATYLTGSLVFGFAANLDRYYDRYLRRWFVKNNDLTYRTAKIIRNNFVPVDEWLLRLFKTGALSKAELETISAKKNREIVNTYKWCHYYLECKQPALVPEIKRIEADSKFFRSLVLAFFIIGIYLLWTNGIVAAAFAIVLSGLCFYRFGNLRYKSTERAYGMVIARTHAEKRKRKARATVSAPMQATPSPLPASKQTTTQFDGLIRRMTGRSGNLPALISVGGGSSWSTGERPIEETYYCIAGKSLVKRTGGGTAEHTVISAGALFHLKESAAYTIENSASDELVLLPLT